MTSTGRQVVPVLIPGAANTTTEWTVLSIMRALDPAFLDVIWKTVEPLHLGQVETQPLGCHRPRVPRSVVLLGILIRLVKGSSWVDIEAILDHHMSDPTLRACCEE